MNIEADPQEEPRNASYEEVAKEMNCSVLLLEKLDRITDFSNDIRSKDFVLKEQSPNLHRNFGWRYCGRNYFKNTNEKTLVDCWIGLFFERPSGYKFIIAFPELDENCNIKKKLVGKKYNFYSEYTDVLRTGKENKGGYWHYVFLDNYFLFMPCCEIDVAKQEIKRIINDVLS